MPRPTTPSRPVPNRARLAGSGTEVITAPRLPLATPPGLLIVGGPKKSLTSPLPKLTVNGTPLIVTVWVKGGAYRFDTVPPDAPPENWTLLSVMVPVTV